jgi:hypothetical protein
MPTARHQAGTQRLQEKRHVSQSTAAIIEMILRNMLREPGARDKRANQRLPVNAAAKVIPSGDKRPIAGHLRNMSSSGIGLILPRPLPHWTAFQLNLPGTTGELIILCTVTRCTRQSDGQYLIGANFTQIIRGAPDTTPQAEPAAPRLR